MEALQLRAEGFIVTTAHGPSEGLQKLQHAQYTICLCDMTMPHKSGCALIAEFREWESHQSRDVPQLIYALTGFIDDNVRTFAGDAGFHGVLSKPLDCAMVVAITKTTHRQAGSQSQ